MKDTAIISSFKRLEKGLNDSHALNQRQIGQILQFMQSLNITLDATINALVERGIFTGDEIRAAIQNEAKRRQEAAMAQKAGDMNDQPEIDTDTSGPTVEAFEEAEDDTTTQVISG
jgi:hypothetical protein